MTAIFNGTTQGLRYVSTPFTALSPLDTDGLWFSAWVYLASVVSGSDYIVCLAEDGAATGDVIGLRVDPSQNWSMTFRTSGGTQRSVAGAAATTGWHLVTGWVRQGSGTNVDISIWVDGETVVSVTNQAVSTLDFSVMDDVNIANLDNGTTSPLACELAGVGVGSGNPSSAHAYAWNSGSAREITGYNFAGDANADIIAYWPFDKAGTDTIDSTDTEAQDSIGSLDTVTNYGSSVWSTRVAPFNAGVTPETGTNGTPAAANSGGRIDLTVTLPTNTWAGTPTVDHTDITVSSIKGYGPISVSSGTATGGSTASTVQLTLSRTIYANEEVLISFATGWLTDSDGNEGAVQSDVAVTMTGANGTPPATSTTWSMGRTVALTTNMTLAAGRAGGFLAGGIPFIVFPSDTNVTAMTPAQATEDQGAGNRIINGAGLNLVRTAAALAQPFNQHDSDIGFGDYWDATRLFTPTAAMGANDVVIKAIARPYADIALENANDFAFVDYYAAFVGLSDAPSNPANTVIPLVGYDGSTARPSYTIDFDAIVAALPSYTVPTDQSNYHTPAQTIRRFCQLNVGRYLGRDVGSRYFVPTSFVGTDPTSDTDSDGYGEDLVGIMAYVAMHLMGDQATTAQKRKLAEWVCIHGCNAYYATSEYGEAIRSPGGHDQGMYWLVALFLYWTNQTSALAALKTDYSGNEGHQPIRHDATSVAFLTTRDGGGEMTTSRTVSGVTGQDVTITGSIFNTDFDTCVVVNHTKGTTWDVDSHSRGSSTFTVEAGHDIEVGNTIWFRPVYPVSVGDFDWGEKPIEQPENIFSNDATYRSLQKWSTQLLILEQTRAINLIEDGDIFQGYVRRCNLADTPVAGADFANHHEHATAAAFWASHNEAILAASTATGSTGGRSSIRNNLRYDARFNIRSTS